MDASRQPQFRFYPGVYADGGPMERSDVPCDVCRLSCGWRYTGSIYAVAKLEHLCARCLADGRTGAGLNGADFTFHDIRLNGAAPEPARELMQRTPGVACFNPFVWPVLDGMPLAYIGVGDDPALIALPEVRVAIAAAFSEIGWDLEEQSPYALLFREVDGNGWRAVIDLD